MGRAPGVVAAVLVTTVLLGAVAAPVAGDRPGAATTPASGDVSTATPDRSVGTVEGIDLSRPDPESIVRLNVTRSGDAEVAIESRFFVNESDDNETEAFESLYQDAQNGNADLLYSEATFQALVDDVSASTGREMAVENARWTRDISNGTGTIALRFTWTNFAIDREETIIVGDAFRTDGGPWLPALADGQRLVLNAPGDYTVLSPSDRVGQSRIRWDGPYEFESGSPSVTFGEEGTSPGTTTAPGPTTTPSAGTTTNGTGSPGDDGSALFWLGLLIVVLSVGGGGYWYFAETESPPGGPDDTPTVAGESAASADAPAASGTGTEAAAAAATAGGVADATAEETSGEEEAADDGVDPELLSDEERVEYLLEENGGRMKQAQIVKETGWSNAKVSQLLSAMDDDERVDKLRIGRENLITLPDEDVTDF